MILDEALAEENQITRHFIDLNWHRENNRSFSILAQSRMCDSCQKKAVTEEETFEIIKKCCSKSEDFVTPNLPLLEMVFRIFLANGNQPLDLEQLAEQMKEWLASTDNLRAISTDMLKRLLDRDQYYGLRQVAPQ